MVERRRTPASKKELSMPTSWEVMPKRTGLTNWARRLPVILIPMAKPSSWGICVGGNPDHAEGLGKPHPCSH